MTVAKLMADLCRLGIRLEPQGDMLRYWPKSAVPVGLVKQLKCHKPALMAMLRFPPPHPDLSVALTVWHLCLVELGRNSSFPPDVIADAFGCDADWEGEIHQDVTLSLCSRCGASSAVETQIHNGQSSRLDCAKCGRFIGFNRWYDN